MMWVCNLLYPRIWVCIFSILSFINFFRYWQGEFAQQSKLLRLTISSFILVIFMNDSAVFLYGEIGCWSLAGFKRVKSRKLMFYLFFCNSAKLSFVKFCGIISLIYLLKKICILWLISLSNIGWHDNYISTWLFVIQK